MYETDDAKKNTETEVSALGRVIAKTRNELKNIRQKMEGLQRRHKKDMEEVRRLLSDVTLMKNASTAPCQPVASCQTVASCQPVHTATCPESSQLSSTLSDGVRFSMRPIGHIQSMFREKNATPRQSSVCAESRATLTLSPQLFTNPHHALQGLEHFSHVWLIFVFHLNQNSHIRAKVAPPRLNGRRVGVYSTRSPHRPNSVGLTLARLQAVNGSSIELSGIDLVDGTPIIDIKPFIPQYDSPHQTDWQDNDQETVSHVDGQTETKEMLDQQEERSMNSVENFASIGCASNMNQSWDTVDSSADHIVDSSANHIVDSSANHIVDSTASNIVHNSDSHIVDNSVSHIVDSSVSHNADNSVYRLDSSACNIVDNSVCHIVDSSASHDLDSSADTVASNCLHHNAHTEPRTTANTTTPQIADWIVDPPVSKLHVTFTREAEDQIASFHNDASSSASHRLAYLKSSDHLRAAVSSILQEDPRSPYRRNKCTDRLYYFQVDIAHVTCWFHDNIAQVLRVVPHKP